MTKYYKNNSVLGRVGQLRDREQYSHEEQTGTSRDFTRGWVPILQKPLRYIEAVELRNPKEKAMK